MASRCDEQEAADDLRKLEAVTSESADVLIAVVKDLQTKSLWISVAVAGTNPYRFMLILVRSCFRLPLLLLDLLVRVLLSAAVAFQMTSFDLLCLFGLQVKHSRRCEKDVKRCECE